MDYICGDEWSPYKQYTLNEKKIYLINSEENFVRRPEKKLVFKIKQFGGKI